MQICTGAWIYRWTQKSCGENEEWVTGLRAVGLSQAVGRGPWPVARRLAFSKTLFYELYSSHAACYVWL